MNLKRNVSFRNMNLKFGRRSSFARVLATLSVSLVKSPLTCYLSLHRLDFGLGGFRIFEKILVSADSIAPYAISLHR